MPKIKLYTRQEVIDLCHEYMMDENVDFVEKASKFAERAHREQMRKSGEKYFTHPIQVAGILADLKMDSDTVATGFLHDVVEDTGISLEDISYYFSPIVANLVDGVTKLGKFKYQSHEEQLAENHRKMLLAMANDLRVVLVKLADRLHNMRTLKFHRPEKQVSISRETLEIYAPLADRLGINQIKWELEDTALRYIDSDAYYQIVHLMNSTRAEREGNINETIENLKVNVAEIVDGECDIYGRPKHIYSIYKKMQEQKKDFNEIYDLLAIRVLVESVKDCYAVLGIIHTNWKPLPGRFKDYIAMPKANLYQSLHTTIMSEYGKPVEIQIRTFEMHEVAEFGVAAHWAYKRGQKSETEKDALDSQLEWFRQLQDLEGDASTATDFVEGVKQDIFKDKVYVFTPQGDVTELPSGASTLDFAYSIHTEVGNKTVGAKVNGKIVPLSYKLKNGDIAEILTSPNSAGPSRDWVKLVTTSRARNKIKRYFKVQDRDENIEKGRNGVEKSITNQDFVMKELYNKKTEEDILNRFNFNDIDDLYAAVGFGELSATVVANRITEEARIERAHHQRQQSLEESLSENESKNRDREPKMAIRHKDGVVIEGIDNLLIRLSHCCNPVPGDDIVGYITKGRGISVHRRDCKNVKLSQEMQDRLIEVEWEDTAIDEKAIYEVDINVEGFDRSALLNDILQVVNPLVKTLTNVNGHLDRKTNTVIIKLRIGIQDVKQLDKIFDKIRSVPDVYKVERKTSE